MLHPWNIKNKVITSLKEIASIANKHYINKINKIREKFTRGHISPISILEKLIVRPKSTFNLPYISIGQTKKIIKN